MGFEIVKADKYSHVKMTGSKIGEKDIIKLDKEFASSRKEGIKNFIIDAGSIKKAEDAFYPWLQKTQKSAKATRGNILITELNDEMEKRCKEHKILTIPSFDESVDYIFMEELEDELMDESDEDLDDGF